MAGSRLRQPWAHADHVRLHPLQGPHANPQDAGSGALVATNLVQDAADVLALDVGERRSDPEFAARAWGELDAKVIPGDERPLRERGRSLDDVFELANVARPVVLVQ